MVEHLSQSVCNLPAQYTSFKLTTEKLTTFMRSVGIKDSQKVETFFLIHCLSQLKQEQVDGTSATTRRFTSIILNISENIKHWPG